MCDEQSLRPACAYAQSDQSLCLSFENSTSVMLRAGPRVCVYGGALQARLEPSGASGEGGCMRGVEGEAHWRVVGGELPRIFFKIYVSQNAFQAILKPSSIFFNRLDTQTPGGYTDIFIHT